MKSDSGTVTHRTIKNFNRNKILNLLLVKRELTKQNISILTGISFPTVTNNIKELINEGLVEEAGMASSTGGRKPQIIRFLPDARYSFGVDLSLEKARVVLINLDSKIKHDESFSIKQFTNMDGVIQKIASIVDEVLVNYSIPKERVLGIGFSLPGTVNEKKMMLELAPNLGVKNISFSKFQEILKFPLYIENEANAAAIAELNTDSTKKYHNLVYISITYGIGTGIVIHGHLYRGKNRRAGEFGHMTVVKDGKQCNCGRLGCWELYASDRVLLEDYEKETGQKAESLDDFFRILKEDNPEAQAVWHNYLDFLALGIQNIILALDPHCIIIGGEISNFHNIWMEELKEKVFVKNSFYKQKDLELLPSRLGKDSSIIGAALLPVLKLFS